MNGKTKGTTGFARIATWRHSAWSWGCAAVVAVFFALAVIANDRIVENAGTTQGILGVFVVLVCAAVLLVLAERAFAWFFYRTEETSFCDDKKPERTTSPSMLAAIAGSWRRAALVFLAWLPYFFVRFPGNLDPDTQWQIIQTYGMAPLTDHHPAFDTLLFGGVWHIGDLVGTHAVPLALYCLVQMAITALVLALSVTFLRERLGASERFCRYATIFYAFFPVIALFAQSMAKDMLFAWIWMLFMLAVADIALSRGQGLTPVRMVLLTVLLVLLVLTKKTGAYIFPFVFVALAIMCRKLWWRAALPAVAALAVFVAWGSFVLPAMGIEKGPSREMFSIPSQQVALYLRNYGEQMDTSEREVLLGVYDDLDAMAAEYTPARADATKAHWKETATGEQRAAFLRWYIGAGVRHPATFVLAFAANDLPILWFDLTSEGDESLLYYRDNVSAVEDDPKPTEMWLHELFGEAAPYDDVVAVFDGMFRVSVVERVSAAFNGIYQNVASVLVPLFAKYAWVTLIPLACTAALLRRRAWWALPVLMAAFLQWGTLVIGPIPLPRYIVPFVYQAPLLIGFALSKVSSVCAESLR